MSDAPAPDAHVDAVTELELRAWALAAVVAVEREAATDGMGAALARDPERAAVLEAAGLVRRDGDRVVASDELGDGPDAGSLAAARLTSLRQSAAAAAGERPAGWAEQPDDVLLGQGRASAGTGRALAARLVPTLPGLAEQLNAPGAQVLDVGTGVGALALAVAQELPQVHVTGIDTLQRAVDLARDELARAGDAARRVDVRVQDVRQLHERDTYDLVWLPAPFLAEPVLHAAIPNVVAALTPGGWLVVGTNPPAPTLLAAAVARWQAARNGGSAADAQQVAALLADAGLDEIDRRPTVPGGPVLVVARRR